MKVEGGLWSIQLFGGLRVKGPDLDVSRFPTKRSALLLARLVLARSGSVSRDDLATLLWPDDFLDSTRIRLRQELNRLRETLGPAAEIVEADRSWIKIDFDKVEVDARNFDRLLARKNLTDEDVARAIDLYTGPLLPEQSEDWVLAERQEYQARFLTELVRHSSKLLDSDEAQEALALALRAVRSDAYHEPARVVAMQALSKIGDVAGALRLYAEFEKALHREYSMRPSDSLQALVASLRDVSKKTKDVPKEVVTEPVAPSEPFAPLPVYLDGIVGRTRELDMVEGWLSSISPTRLVTITGPGGVGKTRFAITAAAAAADSFDGNVFFIGLADIEPGHGVDAKIQKAFSPQGPMFSEEPLPNWGARKCLIVLDNAEHVVDEARVTAQKILMAHPGVSLMVTSRQRLSIGGEQELPLSPLEGLKISGDRASLEESSAAQLFVQRARSARPGYAVADEQIEPLGMLIERLDGLPLSIELAAARIGSMSPGQMLGQIDDQFTFLVSRRSDVGPRQRSLRATIEWSFLDLDDDLKRVMEILAMFRSGWTLDLARAASQRPNIYDSLQDLMDRSLIYADEGELGVRFGMLESIREYVQSNLSEDDAANLRNVHCGVIGEFALEKSRLLTGPEQNRIFELIGAEMDNARAAIEWASARKLPVARTLASSLWRFWCARGKPSEGAELMDRLIAVMPETPHDDWGIACNGRGVIAFLLGDDETCARVCDRAAKIFEQVGNLQGVSWARYTLSRSLLKEGRTREAEENLLFVLKNGLPAGRHISLLKIAEAYTRLDRPEQAMSFAEEGFAGALNHPDLANRAVAHAQLAEIYAACGRAESVSSLLLEALERQQVAPVQDYKLFILIGFAREELRQGRLEECRKACDQAYKIAEDMRDQNSMITLENFRGQAASSEGSDRALEHFEKALKMALPIGGGLATLITVRLLAGHLARQSKVDVAGRLLAMEARLRESLETGLTLVEKQQMEEILELVGSLPEVESVDSRKQLAAKAVVILRGAAGVAV